MFFTIQFLYLTDRLNKVRTKLKNVIKSFEMTLNSNYRLEKIKTENQRNRKMKKETPKNTERQKPSFSKKIGRKCRLLQTRTERNNDHTRVMHSIQFRSSFKKCDRKEL